MNQQLNFSIDPYEVLQIDKNATLNDIKAAYKFLAKQYHPDKGGNPAMWNMLTQSYQTLIKQKLSTSQQPRNTHQREQLINERRGNLNPDDFQGSVFNAQFASLSQNEVDFVYGVDDSIYQPRNLADYKRERDSVSRDLEQIKPIFNKGKGFDPNTFNRVFEKLKKKREKQTKDLIPYQEPQALVSQNQVAFSNLNPHATSRPRHDISTNDLHNNFCELEDQYHAQSFQNPNNISRRELNKHTGQPDITQITAMKRQDLKQRISERNNQQINIPRGQAPPSGDLNYVFDGFDRVQQEKLNKINQQATQPRLTYPDNIPPHHPSSHHPSSHHPSSHHPSSHHPSSHHPSLNHPSLHRPHQITYQAHNPQNTYRARQGELPHPALGEYPQQNPTSLPPPQNSSITQEPVIHPHQQGPIIQAQSGYQQGPIIQAHPQGPIIQPQQSSYQQGPVIQPQQSSYPNQDRLQEMERQMQDLQKTIRVQDKLIRKINRGGSHRSRY